MQGASNKGVDQTVLMHRLVCTIDVCMQQNQVLSQGPLSYFSTIPYVVGTEKNRLNETVLLGTQNICHIERKYLQFQAEKFCLSKPVLDTMIGFLTSIHLVVLKLHISV